MSEKTALWIWPDQYDPRVELNFDAQALAYVRSLEVWWDAAENGAAGVEPPLDAVAPAQAALIVDLFLNTATLRATGGEISNPYAGSADDWRISDVPDAKIAAQFLGRAATIAYDVSDEDRALWAAANRTDEGINCKRPFGSESVAGDLRPLLDPDKTLSNPAFSKRRRAAEARMLLFLQFFVQHAELPAGRYIRGKGYQWRPEAEVEDADGEALPWQGWAERVAGIVHSQSSDYVKTGRAVTHLVWDGRIKGTYAEINQALRLHNLYEDYSEPRYVGRSRDMAEAGVAAFDEMAHPLDQRVLSACLIRILNGTGDFVAAKAAMQAAGVWGIDKADCNLKELNPEALFYLEETIASYGLEEIGGGGFMQRAYSQLRGGGSFIYDILHGAGIWAGNGPDDVNPYRAMRARAVAAQISIMRGRV